MARFRGLIDGTISGDDDASLCGCGVDCRRSFNATRDYTTSTFTVNDAYSVLFQATNLRTGRSTGIS